MRIFNIAHSTKIKRYVGNISDIKVLNRFNNIFSGYSLASSITVFLFQTIFIRSVSDILLSPIEYLKGVGPQRGDLLKKELNIFTFKDLLEHFPYRHVDKTKINFIREITPESEYIQLAGKLTSIELIGERRAKRLVAEFRD